MMVRQSSSLQSAAPFTIKGRITSGATYIDSWKLSQNNLEIEDADTSTWKLLFKSCDNGTAALTLTSGVEITVTQSTTYTLFSAEADIDNMCGDYQTDFAQQTTDGKIIHWASGIVSFTQENLGF